MGVGREVFYTVLKRYLPKLKDYKKFKLHWTEIMFYITPWMAWGLFLCTVYFVLMLLGFGRKVDEAKVSTKSEEKLASSTKTSSDKSGGKQLQLADEKLEVIKRGKQLQGLKSDTQRPVREGTLSCQIQTTNANKSYDVLHLAPANSDKQNNLTVEQSSAPVKSEDFLRSHDALYLQEFSVSDDFINERERIRGKKIITSHANDNFSESQNRNSEKCDDSDSLDVNQVELSDYVTQTSSTAVYSEPVYQRPDIPVSQNEQAVLLCEPCIDVVESNSSPDLMQNSLTGDFAELLVARAKTQAFRDIDLDLTANVYAEKVSAQIVSDAIGQYAADSEQQEVRSAKVLEIHSFAGNVVDSLFQGASGKISLVKDVETFAKDMSEQVINESIDYHAAKVKLEQGRKKKVSLHEMRIFSEGIISEVLGDGIEEAAITRDDFKEDFVHDQNSPTEEQNIEDSIPEGAVSLKSQVCQTSYHDQEFTLSSTLQPHISGVVENLVNGAIYEAVLRVKAQRGESDLEDSELEGCAQEILESQVDETVKELIVSAFSEAADHEAQEKEAEPSHTNKLQLESCAESYKDGAVGEAVSKAVAKAIEKQTVPNQEQKVVVNGKINLPQEPVMEQSCQSTPEIIVLKENDNDMTGQGEGFDVVPSKEKEKLKEKKTGESSDYWRQSLILDLEGEEEFEESIDSEKSPSSIKGEDLISDDESEEFIDSSEDEVIDHAEDAKKGAVGGSSVRKYESDDDDDDDKIDLEDELDDDDDDQDYDGNDMFVPQSMVDGLCASKPKEKRKKKKHKTAPRARVQSG